MLRVSVVSGSSRKAREYTIAAGPEGDVPPAVLTLIRFYKPYGVLSQFTDRGGARQTLADYQDVPGVYPAGRLDRDSEGLLLLTDDGALQARIAHPRHKLEKVYWAQVEARPDAAALDEALGAAGKAAAASIQARHRGKLTRQATSQKLAEARMSGVKQ